MALLKSIPVGNTGNDTTYWNIGGVQEDVRGKGYQVTLYGYKDKAARDAGKDPSDARGVQVALGADYTPDLTRAQIYPLIKATEFWADASDDN